MLTKEQKEKAGPVFLPQAPGQMRTMLITGPDAIEGERGHWYSPDAVREIRVDCALHADADGTRWQDAEADPVPDVRRGWQGYFHGEGEEMSKPGMIETLESAAEIIELAAENIKGDYYIARARSWTALHAKTGYQVRMEIVKRLRKIAEYHKVNPLGGPARVFDCMADRIRAGEDYDFILSEYGFKVDKERK